jgi:hypothetical protein
VAQTTASPEVDLEEPIPSGIEALGKEQIGLVLRVDMRDPPTVDQDFDRLPQAHNSDCIRRSPRHTLRSKYSE